MSPQKTSINATGMNRRAMERLLFLNVHAPGVPRVTLRTRAPAANPAVRKSCKECLHCFNLLPKEPSMTLDRIPLSEFADRRSQLRAALKKSTGLIFAGEHDSHGDAPYRP